MQVNISFAQNQPTYVLCDVGITKLKLIWKTGLVLSHIALENNDFKLERQYLTPIWISRRRQREKGGGPAHRPFFIDQCSVAFDRYYCAKKFARARKWRPDMHSDTHAVHSALSHRHPCRRLSAPAFNRCHCSNIWRLIARQILQNRN